MTRYSYTLLVEEKGRVPRIADNVIADNDAALKRACNALLRPGSKVIIMNRKAVKGNKGKKAP